MTWTKNSTTTTERREDWDPTDLSRRIGAFPLVVDTDRWCRFLRPTLTPHHSLTPSTIHTVNYLLTNIMLSTSSRLLLRRSTFASSAAAASACRGTPVSLVDSSPWCLSRRGKSDDVGDVIGIDLGTTNSCVAIMVRSRGCVLWCYIGVCVLFVLCGDCRLSVGATSCKFANSFLT
jgi:hypothetical protein